MPSPNPARRSSNRGVTKSTPKSKAPDIGKPLGIYDTNSVREKVRLWQQQGGGVVNAKDIQIDEDDENPPKPKVERKPTQKTPHKAVTRLKEEEQEEYDDSSADTKTKGTSTPRKRVVSDEHWKIKRSPPKTPPAKTRPPKRITVYKTNDEFTASPGSKKGDHKTDTSKSLADDSGIRVYATPPSSRNQTKQTKRTQEDDASHIESKIEDEVSSVDHSPSATPKKRSSPKTPKVKQPEEPESKSTLPPEDDDNDWAPSEANFSELSRRRARGPAHDSRRTPKPHKGGIFGHMLDESKKMFARPEPPAPVPNRGAKIEAWLSATSDPFMEEEDSGVEVPAPLKPRSSKKESSQRAETETDELSEKSPDSGSRRRRSTHGSKSRRKDDPYMSDKDNISSRESLSAIAEEVAQTARRRSDTTSSSPLKRATAHKRSESVSRAGKDSPQHKADRDEKDSHHDTESLPFSDGSEVSASDAPLPLRRPFPSTGVHRLSTIPSVETLNTLEETQSQMTKSGQESKKEETGAKNQDDTNLESEERDSFDPNSLPGSSSGLRRRLTTHEDLMSVLSEPRTRNRSTRSTRSVRSNRSRLATATMEDLMQELSSDETKYMRELRTLVGGVIPVLLTCVLSRSDSAIAAGLFRPSLDPKDDLNFTKPIVDMGVALERLKTMHKRIPLDNSDALLTWALGAQRVYRDYLKAWRLGFQDVVVNLAPPEEGEAEPNSDAKSLDQGMARDENGDVVNADGQKVDVAYLLKRPLVRLKYLSKTFRGINTLKTSPKAEEIATAYQALVTEARRRSNEERARLEDESAASIDPTRARDPGTLAVLTGVTVDQTRRVRARDFFDLSLYHSSGQMVDCRSELLLRDNLPENGTGGDLLICEVDNSDRWLLFPPIDISCVSARSGDAKGEVVVMIRSPPGEKKEWQELLSLIIDDGEIGSEWIQLLGVDPVPPVIRRTQSFITRSKDHGSKPQEERSSSDTSPRQKLTPNTSDIDIPIGEQAMAASRSKRRSFSPRDQLSEPSTLSSSSAAKSRTSLYSSITRESDYSLAASESSPKGHSPAAVSDDLLSANAKSPAGLKRSKAKRVSRHADNLPSSPASRMSLTPERDVVSPPSQKHDRYYDAKSATQSPEPARQAHDKNRKDRSSPTPLVSENWEQYQRVSSVPSMDLPTIRKIRSGKQSHEASRVPAMDEDDFDDYSDVSEAPHMTSKSKKGDSKSKRDPSLYTEDVPAPPPHRSPSTAQLKQQNIPILSPTAARQRRRSSSPLKHEYEPSTASDTVSEYSETSTVRHYDMESEYSSSESSDDELEDDDIPTPLAPVQRQKSQRRSAPSSIPTLPSESLDPSNSASQGPYRTVPAQPEKSSKAIASIFGWSDKGNWESIFPDECSITVTPGLIEAFEMSAAHSSPEASAEQRPLIALELTPLVPIRRGTAIDISIRSPPINRSKIQSSNNIMFRSRNTEECEALYAMINYARINNPTYIALQNARGPFAGQPASLERYNSTRSNKSGGWFNWPRRRNSYRASGGPRSLADASESSVGTMSSAFSALKRFGTGSKMFSIARSTITSHNGDKGDSLFSSEASGAKSSGLAGLAGAIKGADGIGLSNAKIRLYLRESQSKWRDLGAARLTIMPASPAPSRPQTAGGNPEDVNMNSDASDSSRPPSISAPARREIANEKRIIIRGKTQGEILLDVCLGESAFERVARTGIAMSVWEENEGGTVAKQGGVTGGSFRIYMIQMKGEAETAYTFGLVGKLRY